MLYGMPNINSAQGLDYMGNKQLQEHPLAQMGKGDVAVITRVDGDDDEMARLKAMGLCTGHAVEVIQHGDPLIVKVIGTRIGVSARLAEKVFVNPDMHTSCPMFEPPSLKP